MQISEALLKLSSRQAQCLKKKTHFGSFDFSNFLNIVMSHSEFFSGLLHAHATFEENPPVVALALVHRKCGSWLSRGPLPHLFFLKQTGIPCRMLTDEYPRQ